MRNSSLVCGKDLPTACIHVVFHLVAHFEECSPGVIMNL